MRTMCTLAYLNFSAQNTTETVFARRVDARSTAKFALNCATSRSLKTYQNYHLFRADPSRAVKGADGGNRQTRFRTERALASTCESTRSPERSRSVSAALSGRSSGDRQPGATTRLSANCRDRAARRPVRGERLVAQLRSLDRAPADPATAPRSPARADGPATGRREQCSIGPEAVINQKQQRAPGRGCPDARWRCLRPRRGSSVVDVTRR